MLRARILAAAVAATAMTGGTTPAGAAPLGGPANDLFVNASPITVGQVIQTATTGAGTEADEPEACLPATAPRGIPGSVSNRISRTPQSVWYAVELDAMQPVRLEVSNSPGAPFAMQAFLRVGDQLTPVACESDAFQLAEPGSVMIRVAGDDAFFRLSLLAATGPAEIRPRMNTDATRATPISIPFSGSTVLDYAAFDPADDPIFTGRASAWYHWIADRDRMVVIRALHVSGAPRIAVYDDPTAEPITASELPPGDAEHGSGEAVYTAFQASEGATYLIEVASNRTCCFPTELRIGEAPELSLRPQLSDVRSEGGQLRYTLTVGGQVPGITSWLTSAVRADIVVRSVDAAWPFIYRSRTDIGHRFEVRTGFPGVCTGSYEIEVTFTPITHVEVDRTDDTVRRVITVDTLPTVPGCMPGSPFTE